LALEPARVRVSTTLREVILFFHVPHLRL
jgi:hypothetical protein